MVFRQCSLFKFCKSLEYSWKCVFTAVLSCNLKNLGGKASAAVAENVSFPGGYSVWLLHCLQHDTLCCKNVCLLQTNFHSSGMNVQFNFFILEILEKILLLRVSGV